ncbi:S1-like domain-containing protein [Erysiphe necator]|nr:S1-like domain-containing protein [Erysiphe necator]
MPRSKRNFMAVAEETCNPPSELTTTQSIAQIFQAEGNNLYLCSLPNKSDTRVLVELPSRFRNAIWLKRGNYVLIDTKEASSRHNKIYGEISNIVRDERLWRKQHYWPKEFIKTSVFTNEHDGQKSTIGKMPSSESEDE